METTAYEQGYNAAKYNDAENPYVLETEEYKDWILGYQSYKR